MTPTAVRRRPGQIAVGQSTAAEKKAIPFDYAFRYQLEGIPGKVLNSIVSVSIEAMFTAVSIGYGVVPKVQPLVFGPAPPPPPVGTPILRLAPQSLLSISLGQIFAGLDSQLNETSTTLKGETGAEVVFKNGLKLNPSVAELALQTQLGSVTPSLSLDVLERLFQVVNSAPELIQFKYAIFDEGSGREFQSEPILNIAGLGSAAGERPFRYFAQPITFQPRSTIRMEITEVSDFAGELHVVLQGYKVLGGSGTPTSAAQQRTGPGRRR
jgi:hypothetical protein